MPSVGLRWGLPRVRRGEGRLRRKRRPRGIGRPRWRLGALPWGMMIDFWLLIGIEWLCAE